MQFSPLGKLCDGQGCIYAWVQRAAAPGKYIGGLYITDRDIRDISLHRIDDEHTIAQVVPYNGTQANYAQYLLLRIRGSTMRAYSIEIEKLNRAYLQELASAGLVRDTTTDLMRRVGILSWEINNKEGLLRILTDVSKLSEEQLALLGHNMAMSSVGASEWSKHVIEKGSGHARLKLENGSPAMNFTSAKSMGCPSVLPPKVFCKQYSETPGDPYPRLPNEVIHFDKYTCGHCRNIENYVAAWQLANQDVTYYSSTVKDWDEPNTIAYNVERVPAFAINRKYIVSLETSDKRLVEYALNLVTALAKER
ncbi:MAG: hypothetical protein QM740_21425 [Acidovorax sp.]